MQKSKYLNAVMKMILLGVFILFLWNNDTVYADANTWYPTQDENLYIEWNEDIIVADDNYGDYNYQKNVSFTYYNYTNKDVVMQVSSSDSKVIKISKAGSKVTLSADLWFNWGLAEYTVVGAGKATLSFKIGDAVYKKTICVIPKIDVTNIQQTGAKSAKITWGKNDAVSGYTIERALISKDGSMEDYKAFKTITKNVSTATITVEWDKRYCYRVKPYILVGKKKVYDESIYYYGNACDFKPQRLGAQIQSVEQVGASTLKITWNKVTAASHYELYRSETENDNYKCIFTTKSANTTSYKQKVAAGKKYHYYLITYVDGKKSNSSKSISQMIQKNSAMSIKAISGMKGRYLSSLYGSNYTSPDTVSYYYANNNLHMVAAEDNCVVDYAINSSGKVVSKKKISIKYDVYGGFYKGTDGKFYVAVGYSNPDESRTKTVIKVIQYTSNWKKVKTATISGGASNAFDGIYEPFLAGNCSMDMKGNTLYLFTARQMFMHSDGLRHQSNISFAINTKTMKASEANESYVSHSFNQFAKFKDGNLYLLDHGDAYPRSLCVTIVNNYASLDDRQIIVTDIFDFMGDTGENYTGCTVGGMEVGENKILVCGSSVPHWNKVSGVTGDSYSYKKNIYVIVVDKKTGKYKLKWLTTYNPKTTTTIVGETRMVKLAEDKYAIMYSTTKNDKQTLHYVVIDENGKKIFSTSYAGVQFEASSQPILYNGSIQWVESVLNRSNYSYAMKLIKIPALFEKTFTLKGNKYEIIDSKSVKFIGISSASATNVIIPATIKYGGITYKVTTIAEQALKDRTNIKSLTVGINVKTIGASAFYGCKKLKTINIEATALTSVGKNALKGINGKATIKVLKSKLTAYKKLFKKKGQGTGVKLNGTLVKKVTLSGNKYEIIDSANVKFIGISSASKTSVTIPATITYEGTTYKVTTIEASALKNKAKIKSVKIGKNVKTIGASAFYGCKKLKTITIESTVLKTVGKNAFKKIDSKATIKVPKSKQKTYKKLLKNKGQGSKVKIKTA